MTTAVKRRRGTTAQHATFTGLEGEISVDTTKDTLVVHDGVTAGGHPLAKETALDAKVTGPASATDNALARFDGTTGKLVQSSGVTVGDAGNLFAAAASFSGGVSAASKSQTYGSAPHQELYDTDGPTDKKYWRWLLDGGVYRLENINDAYSAVVMTPVIFYTSGNATFSGRATFSGGVTVGGGTLGYGAGAGGTVTQATSKSTTVTLNKPSGLITMHNAALAAGDSVAFLVNNTTVSALDIVVMTVYNNGNHTVQATTSLAGQFSVRLTNITAGSLSEAVSINFSVIKGSAS